MINLMILLLANTSLKAQNYRSAKEASGLQTRTNSSTI